MAGGASGSAGSTVLNPGTPAERNIGKIDVLEMKQGDVLRMITPSGGGFGDPFSRDPAAVAEEVAEGMLTPDQARARYGVGATRSETDALRAAPRPTPPFTFGPARRALEATWPEEASAALAAAMLALPAGLRPFRLAALRARLAAAGPVTVDAVRAALAAQG